MRGRGRGLVSFRLVLLEGGWGIWMPVWEWTWTGTRTWTWTGADLRHPWWTWEDSTAVLRLQWIICTVTAVVAVPPRQWIAVLPRPWIFREVHHPLFPVLVWMEDQEVRLLQCLFLRLLYPRLVCLHVDLRCVNSSSLFKYSVKSIICLGGFKFTSARRFYQERTRHDVLGRVV